MRKEIFKPWQWCAGCLLAWASVGKAADPVLRFERPVYFASSTVADIELRVVLDPVPTGGFFSYGVSILFDPNVFVSSTQGIVVPPELDFNGAAGPGAFRQVGAGVAGVKGTVDIGASSVVGVESPWIAAFTLTPRQAVGGTVSPLSVEIFRTLGPTESVFVGADGRVYDAAIKFEGAGVVFAVPEPASLSLMVLGVLSMIPALYGGERAGREPGSVFSGQEEQAG